MKYNRRKRRHTATADRQLYFYAHTPHAGNVYKGVAACQKLPYFICLVPTYYYTRHVRGKIYRPPLVGFLFFSFYRKPRVIRAAALYDA